MNKAGGDRAGLESRSAGCGHLGSPSQPVMQQVAVPRQSVLLGGWDAFLVGPSFCRVRTHSVCWAVGTSCFLIHGPGVVFLSKRAKGWSFVISFHSLLLWCLTVGAIRLTIRQWFTLCKRLIMPIDAAWAWLPNPAVYLAQLQSLLGEGPSEVSLWAIWRDVCVSLHMWICEGV